MDFGPRAPGPHCPPPHFLERGESETVCHFRICKKGNPQATDNAFLLQGLIFFVKKNVSEFGWDKNTATIFELEKECRNKVARDPQSIGSVCTVDWPKMHQ